MNKEQIEIVKYLNEHNGEISQSEVVHDFSGITGKMQISRLISGLEREDLIEKIPQGRENLIRFRIGKSIDTKCFVCGGEKNELIDSELSSETTKRLMCPECKEIYDSYSYVDYEFTEEYGGKKSG